MDQPAKKKKLNEGREFIEIAKVVESKSRFVYEKENVDEDDNLIKEGDLVIFKITREEHKELYVVNGSKFQCRSGLFFLGDLIGKQFGCKLRSRCKKKGTVFVLKPTPQLHEKSINRRTQILFDFDISNILYMLEIKTGDIVVESGTGSGMLSTSIAQLIAPKGKLFTFEYDKARFEKATIEFEKNKLNKYIKNYNRDAYAEGFSDVCPEGTVDAVFLDLPQPWLCIDEAYKILKKGKRLCTFSPCIEQVQKTVEKINSINFTDVRTFEYVKKPYFFEKVDVQSINPTIKKEDGVKKLNYCVGEDVIRAHSGYLTFATKH